jgi:uncharacterized membrane protein
VQQWLAVKLLSQPAQRLAGGLVRYLGVDLHGDRDLTVTEYPHRYPRVYIESSQQRGAGSAHSVRRDVADPGSPASCGEVPGELARRGIDLVALSACQLLAAAVMLAIALGVTGAPAPRLDLAVTASIAILGLAGTGAAYVLNYQIITSEGATIASAVTYLLPVVAIVLGVTALGEQVTLPVITGVALILAGVALTRQPAKPAASPIRRQVEEQREGKGTSRG